MLESLILLGTEEEDGGIMTLIGKWIGKYTVLCVIFKILLLL